MVLRQRKPLVGLMLAFMGGFAVTVPCRSVTFHAEVVEISVVPGGYRVEGQYAFVNDGDEEVHRALYYPFPDSPEQPFPDSIEVMDLTNDEAVPFSTGKDGIRFHLTISDKSTVTYRVTYVQRTERYEARYILTTTRLWGGRSLASADFRIVLPPGHQLTASSYDPDDVEETPGGETIYRIHRERFMPSTDLRVQWREVDQ